MAWLGMTSKGQDQSRVEPLHGHQVCWQQLQKNTSQTHYRPSVPFAVFLDNFLQGNHGFSTKKYFPPEIPTNWYSIWHIFWHYIWHSMWHSFWQRYSDIPSGILFGTVSDIYIYIFWHYWHSIWHSIWRIFWHSIWHSLWHPIWHLTVAVDVRQCPLRSGARGWRGSGKRRGKLQIYSP